MNNTQKPNEEWEKELREKFLNKFGVVDENNPDLYHFLTDWSYYSSKPLLEDVWTFFSQAIQATREETIQKIKSFKGKEYVLDGNDFGYIADERIDDILDSLKAQKKGIRR